MPTKFVVDNDSFDLFSREPFERLTMPIHEIGGEGEAISTIQRVVLARIILIVRRRVVNFDRDVVFAVVPANRGG